MGILFDNFEILADAPNGIQELRELILQLAVMGKLVPQDPKDEPANVLLEKIKAEKEQLVKEKKIRAAKLASELEMPEVNIELPKSWAMAKVADLLVNSSDDIVDGPFGSKLKASEYIETGIPIIRIQNIDRNLFRQHGIQYISSDKAKELKRHNFIAGDIVLNKLGEPAGKACVVPEQMVSGIIVADIIRIRLDESIHNKQFIIHSLNSPVVAFQFARLAKGVTRQRVNLSQVRALKVSLPPFAEQKRIVAKVDQLMALCDELEEKKEKRYKKIISLNNASLDKLLTSQKPKEFQDHWQFITNNFETIYNKPENVTKLKQAILQLAVMGKLVPQDPKDEPANVLLEKIKAEKARLIKEGKIKKQKPLLGIIEDELPYELPDGWKWVRLGDLHYLLSGFAFKSSTYIDYSEHQLIRLGNVKNTGLLLHQKQIFLPDDIAEKNHEYELVINDLLITMTGTRAKRDYCFTAKVTKEDITNKKLYLNQRVGCLRMYPPTNFDLINYFLKSNTLLDYLFYTATGTANQANIGVKAIRELLFSLPPLNEQKRIVSKVDQLMALCDTLEESLKKSESKSEKLFNAVVNQLQVA
jgi:type I restriction enzyme, S subunit